PVLVQTLPRVGVLEERGAVEVRERVLVAREMTRHPVENHAKARLVTRVDEELEILRGTEARRRGKKSGDLVAPRPGEWMLHHRHQLEVGEAQLLHIGHETRGQL